MGPGMTSTVDCEGAAERGEILLSHAAAALLDEFTALPSDISARYRDTLVTIGQRVRVELPGDAVALCDVCESLQVELALLGELKLAPSDELDTSLSAREVLGDRPAQAVEIVLLGP